MPLARPSSYAIGSGARLQAGIAVPLTALGALAASLAVGGWAELTTVTGFSSSLFGPFGTSNTADYIDKAIYDPIHRQVRWIGQAHENNQRWYQYDEDTDTFSVLTDPPWDTGGEGNPGYLGHGYEHNAADPLTGDQYYRMTGSGTVRRLDRPAGTWSALAASFQTSGNGIGGALEWLPSIGTQGGLIAVLGEYVQRWDKQAGSVSTVSSGLTGPGDHRIAHRSIPNDLVLFGGGNGGANLWSVGGSGGITARTSCPIGMGVTQAVTTACPASGDLIVIGSGGAARQYDVPSDTWSTKSMAGAPDFGTMAADSRILAVPVPAYGVILYFFCWVNSGVWVHRHA